MIYILEIKIFEYLPAIFENFVLENVFEQLTFLEGLD